MGAVGDVGIDFDAAVHRAWMEDQQVLWCAGEPLRGHAEHAIVFTQRGDVAALHALELETEDVEGIRPLDGVLDVVEHRDVELVDRVGQQRARPADADGGAHLEQPPDVRAGNARVQDVAADADLEAVEPLEVIAQGEHVEQPLRGVFVRAVAGVDDVGLDALREELRGAGRPMADDDHVDAHGFEVARGVHECLALADART